MGASGECVGGVQPQGSSRWLWVFGVLAIAYLLLLNSQPFSLDFLVKAAPIYCLAFIALNHWQYRLARGLFVGLCFSSLGDVLLALPWQHSFPTGLGAFLVAQFIYAVLFGRLATREGGGLRPLLMQLKGHWAGALLTTGVVVYYLSALMVLLPKVGELAPAVLVYMSAICAMVMAATLLWVSGRQGGGWVLLGALSFLVSDSLIGLNKFLLPFELAELSIMSSYYLAQCLIVVGVLAALRSAPLND